MKYCEMRETFKEELAFLGMITEYETGLEPIHNLKEAAANIKGWQNDGYDDFPSSFARIDGPSILMSLWNTFIVPDEETKKAIKDEEYDEQFKKDHPDWLAFDACYPNGSCLFIDPESIDFILQQHHYDSAHRELIVEAIKAYHKSCEKGKMDAYDRCCTLAREIARTGWTNSLNPMVKELTEEADQAGIEISFDDCWIAVNDEVFYLEER